MPRRRRRRRTTQSKSSFLPVTRTSMFLNKKTAAMMILACHSCCCSYYFTFVDAYQPIPLSPLFSSRYNQHQHQHQHQRRQEEEGAKKWIYNVPGTKKNHRARSSWRTPAQAKQSPLFSSSSSGDSSPDEQPAFRDNKTFSKRVMVARLLVGLLVFGTGYRWGVSRPEEQVLKRLLLESSSSSAGAAAVLPGSITPSRRLSTMLLTLALFSFLVRDGWRAIPSWAKPSLIQRAIQDTKRLFGLSTITAPSSSGKTTSTTTTTKGTPKALSTSSPAGQELLFDDDDDISNFATLTRKLNGVLRVAQRRMPLSAESMNAFNWQASLLALWGMLQQQKADSRSGSGSGRHQGADAARPHPARDAAYASCGSPVTATDMDGLDQWMDLADAAYNEFADDDDDDDDEEPQKFQQKTDSVAQPPQKMTLSKYLQKRGYDLIKHDVTVLPGYLCHYVALSRNTEKQKVALIGVKGTSTLEDMITDMCGAAISYELPGPFTPDGHTTIRAHEGILLSTRRLVDQLQPLVEKLLVPQEYKIVIVGHSLGAAAAALLGVLLQSRIPALQPTTATANGSSSCNTTNKLQVYAFASPPNLDRKSALACGPFVTTIVNNCDVIPRCNAGPVLVTMELLKTINDKILLEQEIDDEDTATRTTKRNRLGGSLSMMSWTWKILLQTTSNALVNQNGGRFFGRKTKKMTNSGEDDEQENLPMLMNSQQLEEAKDQALEKVGFNEDDQDQLYVPGKVILMYNSWEKEAKYSGKREQKEEIFKDLDNTNSSTENESADMKYDYSADRAVVAKPTAKVLRLLEFDGRMVEDHMAPSYKNSLKTLCRLEEGTNETT